MMKVTKTTFNTLAANRAVANKKTVMVQAQLKSGKWGKPFETERFGQTDEQIIERLTKLNNKQYRIAD